MGPGGCAGGGEMRAPGVWKTGGGGRSAPGRGSSPRQPRVSGTPRACAQGRSSGSRCSRVPGNRTWKRPRCMSARGQRAESGPPPRGRRGEARAGATRGHPHDLGRAGDLPWDRGAQATTPLPPPAPRARGRNPELSLLLCDAHSRPRGPGNTRLAERRPRTHSSRPSWPRAGEAPHAREGQTPGRPGGSRPPALPHHADESREPEPGPGRFAFPGAPSSGPTALATNVAEPGRVTNVSFHFCHESTAEAPLSGTPRRQTAGKGRWR